MASGTMAFLGGIIAALQLPYLPPELVYPAGLTWLAALGAALLVSRTCPLRWVLLAGLGLTYTVLRASLVLDTALPTALEGRDVHVQGRIVSLPQADPHRVRFDFEVRALRVDGAAHPAPRRIRLSWYSPPRPPAAEQRCQLTVRLKRPHGLSNPGGFDYERWLYQHGVRATGYVRHNRANRCRPPPSGHALQQLRQRVRHRFKAVLGDSPVAGALIALAVGDRSGISEAQWRVFRNTGTGHLVAISGLHVGLVAALVFFLFRRLWRPAWLLHRVPAPVAAALAALTAAAGYAALAGFTVPTQRALVMVGAVLIALVLRRRVSTGATWIGALAGVLVFDPMAPLAPGFWLSFGAVAIIFYAVAGRLQPAGPWWRWGRVQMAVALGLMPIILSVFGLVAPASPLANLLAVPWVGFLVVPMSLLGALCALVAPTLAHWPILAAAWLMEPLWQFLGHAAALLPGSYLPRLPLALAVAGLVGAALMLAPQGVPLRLPGAVLFGTMFLYRPPAPAAGAAWMTLLDVGQGLAVVVRTHRHLLLFDTGAHYRTGFDLGQAVIEPYLRRLGIARIDTLVVSHGDNDHIGGAAYLLRRLAVGRVLTGVPARFPPARQAVACRRGQHWTWDGVRFSVLHPQQLQSGNDGSCVLRVESSGGTAALLPGDIEAPAERDLLRGGLPLQADVLVAPHHGSNSSSTAAFIRAVGPRVVLFPAGYRNRYHFPHSAVIQRYARSGVALYGTARDGALTVVLGPEGHLGLRSNRRETLRFWHSPVTALGGWSAL